MKIKNIKKGLEIYKFLFTICLIVFALVCVGYACEKNLINNDLYWKVTGVIHLLSFPVYCLILYRTVVGVLKVKKDELIQSYILSFILLVGPICIYFGIKSEYPLYNYVITSLATIYFAFTIVNCLFVVISLNLILEERKIKKAENKKNIETSKNSKNIESKTI